MITSLIAKKEKINTSENRTNEKTPRVWNDEVESAFLEGLWEGWTRVLYLNCVIAGLQHSEHTRRPNSGSNITNIPLDTSWLMVPLNIRLSYSVVLSSFKHTSMLKLGRPEPKSK